MILRTASVHEQAFRHALPRLVLNLEAHILNGVGPDRENPPASEIIWNGRVEDVEKAYFLTDNDPNVDENDRYVYAFWKLSVFLDRPRMRLQHPSVVFSGSAALRSSSKPTEQQQERLAGYMQSCMPSAMNLLDTFAHDPMLGGIRPRLSAQRVSRVAPLTKPKDVLRRIDGLQHLRLRIYPVLHTRVRFSRPNTAPPSTAVIAMLEIDFTPYFDCEIVLDGISLTVAGGTVEDLNNKDMTLPLSCVAHDHLTFLYKLSPQPLDFLTSASRSQPNLTRDLAIKISARALVRPDTDGEPNPCTPGLTMSWTTTVDFTPPVNPGFGKPSTQPMQRAHKPSQLSISGGVVSQPLVSPSVIRPDALPSLEASTSRAQETQIPELGITLTFTGPSKPVRVGEEFVWSVSVVNRSRSDSQSTSTPGTSTGGPFAPTTRPSSSGGTSGQPSSVPGTARKLLLIPLPRRRRNETRVSRPIAPSPSPNAPNSTSSQSQRPDIPPIAPAIQDEALVHAMQRSSVADVQELACLSADIRVGPLAGNACAMAEMRFVPLREGVLGLEAVRVVDVATGEHVDVREVPGVVAVR